MNEIDEGWSRGTVVFHEGRKQEGWLRERDGLGVVYCPDGTPYGYKGSSGWLVLNKDGTVLDTHFQEGVKVDRHDPPLWVLDMGGIVPATIRATTSMYSSREGYRLAILIDFEEEGLRITPKPGPVDGSFFLDGPDLFEAKNDGWKGWYGGFPKYLLNDSMTMPANFTSYLRSLWRAWKNGRVDEAEANRVAHHLFEWLDAVNAAEPRQALRDYR